MADVTETRHGASAPAARRARPGVLLLFTEDAPIDVPVAFVVERPARVGRDPSVEIQLPDSQASREHAEIAPGSSAFVVTDRNSRNGTWVAGTRVTAPASPLAAGQTLRVGRSLLLASADVAAHRAPVIDELPGVIGGAGLLDVVRAVQQVAPTPTPVLIEGETGVGKERVCAALHALSGRRGQLIAVNCAALPRELVESELFGHAKGAFSGSDKTRRGLFKSADGGTLFLDEIAELPLESQAKLLRVLETGEVRAVGEDVDQRVDVRVVAATNANLEARVQDGRFRADLLHRLAAWRVRIPALRERREDVPRLCAHFAPDARFSVETVEQLVAAPWPGNVRELAHVVRAAAQRARGGQAPYVLPEHLQLTGAPAAPPAPPAVTASDDDAVFRARVDTALTLREGNVAQVARDLGVGRPWLYKALDRLGIDPAAYRRK